MAEDLLRELLRRRGGTAAPAESASATLEVVGGTDAAENVEGKNRTGGWLDIRPVRGPGSLISYSELLQVDYDRPNLTFIVLIFRHVMVTVKGRNLEALFSGIQMRLTKTIQQHDPRKDTPSAPGALLVESIDFTYQRLSESVGMMMEQRK